MYRPPENTIGVRIGVPGPLSIRLVANIITSNIFVLSMRFDSFLPLIRKRMKLKVILMYQVDDTTEDVEIEAESRR